MCNNDPFKEIRPYKSEELPGVIDSLAVDYEFRTVIEQSFPEIPFEAIIAKAKTCRSLLDIQKTFAYPFLKKLIAQQTSGAEMDVCNLDKSRHYTFMSNHRDIVLDSAFLCMFMLDVGFNDTVEIAIGDNLLIKPWIDKTVRLIKSFIVKRGLHGREKLMASQQLSDYMHWIITSQSIWIAQRQGRAKDSNDLTQESLLKMMRLGGEGSIIERLQQLHIVPLSISYEYDPCDYLKAKEFQQKRDNPDFVKNKEDDFISMREGINGYKGHIHYQTASCIDSWLSTLDANKHKTELYPIIASHIDKEIHMGYKLYANNYIAYDLLNKTTRFSNLYTAAEKEHFIAYVTGQIKKIDLVMPDYDYLEMQILGMYANPLVNYLKAAESHQEA